ncbi:MAG: hypothetical protein ACTSU5_10320 [Promethearchaeota archaeon]
MDGAFWWRLVKNEVLIKEDKQTVLDFIRKLFETIKTKLKNNKARDEELESYPTERELDRNIFHGISFHLELLQANLVIIEMDYVDLDYWEDFSKCLVKEYYHLRKNCHRITFFHFPDETIDYIADWVKNNEFRKKFVEMYPSFSDLKKLLQSGFLGSIVIRPLPIGYFGRTYLKPLSIESFTDFDLSTLTRSKGLVKEFEYYHQILSNGKLVMNTLRDVEINLLGIPLSLTSALWVERCPSAGMCSSSSIYIALDLIKDVFCGFAYASLSKITYIARNQEYSNPLLFHGEGLAAGEMRNTFDKLNLGTHSWIFASGVPFIKSIIGTYLSSGLPVILIVSFFGKKSDPIKEDIMLGSHTLTAIGYHYPEKGVYDRKKQGLLFESMDNLVVQDDIRHPFAVLKFREGNSEIFEFPPYLKEAYRKDYPEIAEFECRLTSIIVALDDLIQLNVSNLIPILEKIRAEILKFKDGEEANFQFFWNIELEEIHRFRQSLINQRESNSGVRGELERQHTPGFSEEAFRFLLKESGPKYFWRVLGWIVFDQNEGDEVEVSDPLIPFIEIHFDASGIAQDISIRRIIFRDVTDKSLIIIKKTIYEYLKSWKQGIPLRIPNDIIE